MMPISLSPTELANAELLHSALADGLDDRLRKLYLSYKRLESLTDRYLELLMQYGSKRLLLINVSDMRTLVQRVNKFLPSSNFYLKRTSGSQVERLFALVNKQLARIFDYDAFSQSEDKWSLAEWARRLSSVVRVCPYCNAETVYAYDVGTRVRGARTFKIHKSSFDHYYPRARYPFLGLSLYNLIPACPRCNSGLKRDMYKGLDQMTHPYELKDASMGIHKNMKFHVLPKSIKAFRSCCAQDIADVVLTERRLNDYPRGRIWERTFCLNDAYSQLYLEDAADAMLKAVRFPRSYVEQLRRQLQSARLSTGRLERIVYGAPLDAKMINVTRLGKLIIDTIETYQGGRR